MTTLLQLKPIWLSATLVLALSSQAGAGLITNGGFESGFSTWTRADQLGSEGTFALQTGTLSPVNGNAVPSPPGGTTAAMTDAQGPGSHVLYQDFTVAASMLVATLHFDLFIGNRAGMFFSPSTLDFSTPALNQQARVDILLGSASPFSIASGDVLMNVFQTSPGNPGVSGYANRAVDITALINSHLGTPLRLRFAEVDNVFTFQLGVDNVDIDASAVPEPSSWMLALGALLAIGFFGRRSVLS
jgi:hypothetical protein